MELESQLPREVDRLLKPYRDHIRVVVHRPVHSCRDVSSTLGVPMERIAKAILWDVTVAEQQTWVLTVVPASSRVSTNRVLDVLGATRIALSKNGEHITGFPEGAFPPFALPPSISILLDPALAALDFVWFGSGLHTVSLRASGEVLAALTKGKVVPLTEG